MNGYDIVDGTRNALARSLRFLVPANQDEAQATKNALRDAVMGRVDAARGMFGAAQELATNRNALAATLASMPKPFDTSPEAMERDRKMVEGFWNPAGLLGTFAGVGAKTANKAALEAAQKMEKAGADRGAIWNETGWFKGPDSKWRFEIDDSAATVWNLPNHIAGKRGTPAIDYSNEIVRSQDRGLRYNDIVQHPELYAAYEEFPGKLASVRPMSGGQRGELEGGFGILSVADNLAPVETKSTALHEMQHAIQKREGFARGGTPAMLDLPELKSQLDDVIGRIESQMDAAQKAGDKRKFNDLYVRRLRLLNEDGYSAYKSLAGEAEARATQARMNMTPAERKAKPPWESYDIPWDQLIIR